MSSAVNRRTLPFKEMFDRLPDPVQRVAEKAFELFIKDPAHPRLRVKALKPNHRGHHKEGSVSVSILMGYRAIYVEVDGVNVWYWMGSHSDNDSSTGVKS